MSDPRIDEFLAAVRAAPDDDTTRIVLADLYEETGELDRATLIRKQIERARHPAWAAEVVRLELEERALLARHGDAWRAQLPKHLGVRWGDFRRGLVDRVAFDEVALLAKHGAECAAAAPISGVMMHWPRLGDRPELAPITGLRALTVVGTLLSVDDMRWLAESPLLSTVHSLELVGTRMGVEALEVLLASPYIGQLRALRMPLHGFGTEGVELFAATSMPSLEDLDLSVETLDELGSGGRDDSTIDADDAMALSRWPSIAKVRSLNLSGNQIGLDGLLAIVSSKLLVGLKTLRIRGVSDWDYDNDGRPEVLPALAHAIDGLQLDELEIAECDLDQALAEALASARALAQLKVLSFDYINWNAGLSQLVSASWFDSLRIFSASDFGDLAFIETLKARAPKLLHTLRLGSTHYWSRTEAVGNALAGGAAFPSLLSLELTDVGNDDQTLAALEHIDTLPRLIELRMSSADEEEAFSESALASFVASPLGKRLVSFEVGVEQFDRLPRPPPFSLAGDGRR